MYAPLASDPVLFAVGDGETPVAQVCSVRLQDRLCLFDYVCSLLVMLYLQLVPIPLLTNPSSFQGVCLSLLRDLSGAATKTTSLAIGN